VHKDSILSIALIDTTLQRMSNIVPYLVVGGGPTGLTAALEMARRGLPVHIIDDDFGPSPESRALAIHAPTLDMLEASGVTERLLAAGHKIRNIVVHEKGRIILALPLSDIPHRYNFILALPQSHTEQILTDALAETGVQLGYGTRLESFSCTGNGATATLVANARRQQVAAAAVIGADGAHSIVRKQAGISFDGESEPQQFGLADITLDVWPWPFDTAVAELLDDGVVGFIPMAEGFGRLISNREHALDATPHGASISQVGWTSSFRVSYRQVETYQRDCVYLAGDAAHIHSPAGGMGMNLGMADAATLARLLAEGAEDQYTRLRHAAGQTVLKQTRGNTRAMTRRGPVTNFMIHHLAPLALSIGPLRRRALSGLAGLGLPATWR